MGANGKARSPLDLSRQAACLNRAGGDILNAVARITDEVVVVIAVPVGQLIPGRPFPQRHTPDHVEALEEAESPVHGREVDRPTPKRPVDFLCPQRARLRGQNGEDRRPGLRPGVSPPAEEDPDIMQCLIHDKLQMICKFYSEAVQEVNTKGERPCREGKGVYNGAPSLDVDAR